MEKYFIGLDDMSLEELEVWRLLCRYSNYETNVAGYTVNQLVVGADKRLGLTTQRVRTLLKQFEKKGYIKFLTSGSKGKESTLLLTIKQQLFNNNVTNKTEHLQQVEEIDNNNLTTIQQQSNNTTKKKKKNNNIYIDLIEAYTQDDSLVKAIHDFIDMRKTIKKPLTERALKGILNKLDLYANDDTEKIEILEASIEHCWLGVFELKNKKGPTAIGPGNKNNSYGNSICNNARNNTPKIIEHKFI